MSLDALIAAFVGRWLRRRRRNRPASAQMAVFCPDTIGDSILINGVYEHRELNALATWLQAHHPGCLASTALAVGANIGNHTRYFAGMFRRVVAYEPNPRRSSYCGSTYTRFQTSRSSTPASVIGPRL
ncbi:MAG: hypothetical protein R3E54_06225 [Halioglobus sp.]